MGIWVSWAFGVRGVLSMYGVHPLTRIPHKLDGAIIRAGRAEEHIHNLTQRIDDLGRLYSETALSKIDLDTLDPSHQFVHEGQLLGAADSLQLDIVESPLILSVLIGEACYNLRAALDYLVYELAREDSGRSQDGTQFPIEDTPEQFARRKDPNERACCLRGVNRAHIAMIEALQPYKGCDWTKTLRTISNPDKHRRLTVTISHRMGFVKFFRTPPVVQSEGPVRRAQFRGSDVYVQCPVSVVVLFPDGSGVVKTLHILQAEVAQTLDAFKPEFK